jgi:subtilase family serine protease
MGTSCKNQGTVVAGPSVTVVDFFAYGKFSMPTPPLAPGASVDLFFLIPTSPKNCFDPDCEFRITVDAMNQVVESNEANNIASGTCLG